jgi:hypothetical protein
MGAIASGTKGSSESRTAAAKKAHVALRELTARPTDPSKASGEPSVALKELDCLASVARMAAVGREIAPAERMRAAGEAWKAPSKRPGAPTHSTPFTLARPTAPWIAILRIGPATLANNAAVHARHTARSRRLGALTARDPPDPARGVHRGRRGAHRIRRCCGDLARGDCRRRAVSAYDVRCVRPRAP